MPRLPLAERGKVSERYWGTPPEMMAALQAEFAFDFDACPHPRPEDFDGLEAPWGSSTWVNPPFKGKMAAWVRRAAKEPGTVVIAIPCFRERAVQLAGSLGAELRWWGFVPWRSLETGKPGESRPMLLAIWKRPALAPSLSTTPKKLD